MTEIKQATEQRERILRQMESEESNILQRMQNTAAAHQQVSEIFRQATFKKKISYEEF